VASAAVGNADDSIAESVRPWWWMSPAARCPSYEAQWVSR